MTAAAHKPITIIGGGLAGLTLGIGLRQRGIPVTIWEAGAYPRHRVCGEFISGRGEAVLGRMGLLELLRGARATSARTAAFYLDRKASPVHVLPAPAICLARFALDALLAQRFRDLGGELRENARWLEARTPITRQPDSPNTPRPPQAPEGVVRASGRRLQLRESGRQWFGLKIHAHNVPLAADLEVHCTPSGYVGLCRLPKDTVNICGIFRSPAAAQSGARSGLALLRGRESSALGQRLAAAEFVTTSFCSVAGMSLRPLRATGRGEFCIGDALTMIPPVTGNGMSMAFEAAELAIEPVAAYSQGQLTWTAARRSVAEACDLRFACRLAWAKWLQWLLCNPVLQATCGARLLHSGALWRTLFTRTR